MREIKFRVWTGIGMEYNIVVGKLGAFYVSGLDKDDSACLSSFNTIYSKETPVMQFTGLKDKNGKEIYEGDIVNITLGLIEKGGYTERGVMEFNQEFAQFSFLCKDSLFNHATKDSNFKIEVIGNIYENPELLGK